MAEVEPGRSRRYPYFRWFHAREWGIHRSVDQGGPVVQINFGRLGLTVPTSARTPSEGG